MLTQPSPKILSNGGQRGQNRSFYRGGSIASRVECAGVCGAAVGSRPRRCLGSELPA